MEFYTDIIEDVRMIDEEEYHIPIDDEIPYGPVVEVDDEADEEESISIDEQTEEESGNKNGQEDCVKEKVSEFLGSKKDTENDCRSEHIIIAGHDFWIPIVPDDIKPKVKGVYASKQAIEDLYFKYADAAGFTVRKNTQRKVNGIVTLKYLLCNKQGLPNTSSVDTMDPRKSKIRRRVDTCRCECNARIRFKIIPGTSKWVLYEFEEKHTHDLISKDNMQFSRYHRQLDNCQKSFIQTLSNQNIGATVAHRLFSVIQGGYNIFGGLVDDFKNYIRDLNCFIGGSDAQMLVDKMSTRKENVENFSFDFRVDDQSKQLNALFWADETAKLNYKEFGDVVSFDATFRTNRYHMVFVPFTGIDNHKKSVTFGAGLLCREDIDSYTWLLESFLKAFKKQPTLVLSDQDPAMKRAIANVFPQSNHRLCMWHIISKLPVKVAPEVFSNHEFKKRFNSLIWNSTLEEKDFEEGWLALIDDYNLNDNNWLQLMYDNRDSWIPAFFKKVPLSGLMRTTSRSESQNSAFHQNTHYGSTLVHFMISFEAAMEKQRFTQSSLDFNTKDKNPKMLTPFEIEYKASLFYTRTVFKQVQNEIYMSMLSCTQISQNSCAHVDHCLVREFRHDGSAKSNGKTSMNVDSELDHEWDQILKESDFKVTYDRREESFQCPCMKFEQFGVLCRHIFTVFRSYNIKDIPSKYLLRRWQNGIIPSEMLRRCFRYADSNENVQRTAIGIFSSVDNVVSSLSYDQATLDQYFKEMQDLETKFLSLVTVHDRPNKNTEFEKRLGVTTPSVVIIENPTGVRNKGCGTRKRMKSAREVAVEKSHKGGRCSYCHKGNDHDWRNCPARKEDEKNNIFKKRPGKKD